MLFHDLWNSVWKTAPIWGPFLSALIAAFLVHLLTQFRERERWILDCKKQEFKELMSAISESYLASLEAWTPLGPPPRSFVLGEQAQRTLSTAKTNGYRVMNDRIYIVRDLDLRELSSAWMTALNSEDLGRLEREYTRISAAIIRAANKADPKFWKR
jgi:hypothetical protein